MTNAINPSHYKSGTIECIDAMKACSTPEEFRGHLKLTVLKYLWREDKKGEGDLARVENLEKAAWYLERLIRDLRGPGVAERTFTDPTINTEFPDAIPPHTINAADQGWIEWKGGECPVPANTMVEVVWSGNKQPIIEAYTWNWAWHNNGGPGDITRYRVVK